MRPGVTRASGPPVCFFSGCLRFRAVLIVVKVRNGMVNCAVPRKSPSVFSSVRYIVTRAIDAAEKRGVYHNIPAYHGLGTSPIEAAPRSAATLLCFLSAAARLGMHVALCQLHLDRVVYGHLFLLFVFRFWSTC